MQVCSLINNLQSPGNNDCGKGSFNIYDKNKRVGQTGLQPGYDCLIKTNIQLRSIPILSLSSNFISGFIVIR